MKTWRNYNDNNNIVDYYYTNQLSAFKSSMINEVLYGIDNVINVALQFFSKAKSRIDTHTNYTPSPLGTCIETIKKVVLGEEKRRTTRATTILHFSLPTINDSLNQSLKTKEGTDKQLGHIT